MIRLAFAALAALCVVGPADAANVRSRSGANASVAPQHAAKFQCLVNRLEAAGVRITLLGGYGSRDFRGSKHPHGAALDVNQYARNVTRPHVPAGVGNAAARACGLIHGAVWRSPDGGHFEVPGRSGRSYGRGRAVRAVEWPFGNRRNRSKSFGSDLF